MSANTANKHWQLQFSLAAIQKVQEEFEKVDAVDETKFIQIIRQILTKVKPNKTNSFGNRIDITTDGSDAPDSAPFDDDDLGHLFLMIDASSGTITFKQFSSYLFLSEKVRTHGCRRTIHAKFFQKPLKHLIQASSMLTIYFSYRVTTLHLLQKYFSHSSSRRKNYCGTSIIFAFS